MLDPNNTYTLLYDTVSIWYNGSVNVYMSFYIAYINTS